MTSIDWLINYIVFYAVSAIFRPYNGGTSIVMNWFVIVKYRRFYFPICTGHTANIPDDNSLILYPRIFLEAFALFCSSFNYHSQPPSHWRKRKRVIKVWLHQFWIVLKSKFWEKRLKFVCHISKGKWQFLIIQNSKSSK